MSWVAHVLTSQGLYNSFTRHYTRVLEYYAVHKLTLSDDNILYNI